MEQTKIKLYYCISLILKLLVMLRKLLFICLTIFAFSQVNAQEHIVTEDTGCGGNIYEFVSVADVNGRNAYDVVPVGSESAWGLLQSATGHNGGLQIQYSITNARWEFFTGSTIIFVQTTHSGTLAPADGWEVIEPSPCNVGNTLSMISENGGVLPVDKNEFSKISLYPNPSNGVVNISNLEDVSRVKITNIAGQIVRDVTVTRNDSRIDIQDLSKGFYFVEIEGKKTIKLIKQ